MTVLNYFKKGPQKFTAPDTNLKNISTSNVLISTLATSNAGATNSSTLVNTSNISLLESPEVHEVSQICSPLQNVEFFLETSVHLAVHSDTPNTKKTFYVTSTLLTKSLKK